MAGPEGMDADQILEDVGAPGTDRPAAPPADEWRLSKDGKEFYNPTRGKPGRPRVIYRQGSESIAEAVARDQREQQQRQRDKRPRKKQPKMPDPPRGVDLKELEHTLAEALKAPAMLCASFGDEWAAEHFTRSGPYLARNLILASEHNPWLRRKLEEAATGEDAMMMVVSIVGVGGALFAYVVPPAIWWLSLPVSPKTRELFGIPDKQPRPAYAADQAPEAAQTAEFPQAA